MFRVTIIVLAPLLTLTGCRAPETTKSSDTAIGHNLEDSAAQADTKTEDTAGCPYTLLLSDALPYGPICSGDLVHITNLTNLVPGDLFQSEGSSGTYYYTSAGRFVVPHGTVFESWWGTDVCACAQVSVVSEDLAREIALMGDLTIKPGSFIIKLNSNSGLYVIEAPHTLRRASEDVIAELYGASWTNLVREIPEIFLGDYTVGTDVATAAEYDLTAATATKIKDVLVGY